MGPLSIWNTMITRESIRNATQILPRPIVDWMRSMRLRLYSIPPGSINFGDLRRLSPISRTFGFERGTPIDRHYIAGFLGKNAEDIRGRVLEVGDNHYTRRFGGTRVQRSDVLSVEANPHATIVGDLAQCGTLPNASFDCIVLTQVLQYLFDLRAGIASLHRALKPGGVLLLTAPALTQCNCREPWTWYWRFTASAIRRLCEEQFGTDAVFVESHGNVFTTTAFLYGISAEELDNPDLSVDDPNYPIVITARVTRQESAPADQESLG